MARPDPKYAALGWVPQPNPPPRVPFYLRGRKCYIDPLFVPLWTEMEAALEYTGYENPCDWIGIWKYRVVTGTNQLSRHSYLPGIAIDLDYGGDTDGDGDPTIDRNPHLHRPVRDSDWGNTIQLMERDVNALLSLETNNGYQALRWLGFINGDAMHFDVRVSPDDIATGIKPFRGDDLMPKQQWDAMIEALFVGRPDMFIGDPNYWKQLDPDSPEWVDFFNAFVRAISNS